MTRAKSLEKRLADWTEERPPAEPAEKADRKRKRKEGNQNLELMTLHDLMRVLRRQKRRATEVEKDAGTAGADTCPVYVQTKTRRVLGGRENMHQRNRIEEEGKEKSQSLDELRKNMQPDRRS